MQVFGEELCNDEPATFNLIGTDGIIVLKFKLLPGQISLKLDFFNCCLCFVCTGCNKHYCAIQCSRFFHVTCRGRQ